MSRVIDLINQMKEVIEWAHAIAEELMIDTGPIMDDGIRCCRDSSECAGRFFGMPGNDVIVRAYITNVRGHSWKSDDVLQDNNDIVLRIAREKWKKTEVIFESRNPRSKERFTAALADEVELIKKELQKDQAKNLADAKAALVCQELHPGISGRGTREGRMLFDLESSICGLNEDQARKLSALMDEFYGSKRGRSGKESA